ncbi:N-6 DNA Methylase [Microbacterium testaceum StLB037]|uniref:site-specific DNA-methyltransferase (adenine-specific) n=2 Tax=Microbacterium testaceum TaxID=2033 RepID=A0A1H0Q8Y9_MICTS|nr:N-6 DNA Methylase [Microbacterium testaceum StLB037]
MVEPAVRALGKELKHKLAQPSVTGDPEDQLRTPLDSFLRTIAELLGFADVNVIGEVKMADVSSRPDFALTLGNALTGFVEIKALGKGADPRTYKGHDKAQFERLKLLPNVLYTDSQSWSLWQNGVLVGRVEHLDGDVRSAGDALASGDWFEGMLQAFLSWKPIPPSNAGELARVSARLCRLFRAEVVAELSDGARTLRSTADDWRHLLFPTASDEQFADGYAQAVMFGLLIARAKGISIEQDTDQIGKQLGATNSLVGRAMQVLGSVAEDESGLKAVLDTAKRVLSTVDWPKLEKGSKRDAWLYFYEDFLATYDSDLRKQTGSYYTPIPVVAAMTRLTDEAIRSLLGLQMGLADDAVTLIDPAMGTGAFLLEALRLVADRHAADYGAAAQGPALTERLKKVIGFEIQLGPYAVAQLRLLAELTALGSAATADELRTYVADTLSDPNAEHRTIGQFYEPIAESRRNADRIKRDEQILVVLGNPPYKDKAKGKGGWIETGANDGLVPLNDYTPPKEWKLGPHVKQLRNSYVYFWRWATWKVFDSVPKDAPGIVTFITVAGFLDGDGFQQMRASLRNQATDIFVIECSPEGLMPPVSTRIFQAVPHPVCIVMAVRRPGGGSDPATVRVRSLTAGDRAEKFQELAKIKLDDDGWSPVSTSPRAPFTAVGNLTWTRHPLLGDLFAYDASGVMPGRTWVVGSDAWTLNRRIEALQGEPDLLRQRALFIEGAGLRVDKALKEGLPGYSVRPLPIASDTSTEAPIRYSFRHLDRAWIIPDKRVLNRPNPTLWATASDAQVYLTAPNSDSPTHGPAVTVAASPPDMHHHRGHGGGRVYPLWADKAASVSNVRSTALEVLSEAYMRSVTAEEVVSYIVGVTSNAGYTQRFASDLVTPGIRVPFPRQVALFDRAVSLGKQSIWYQTYGLRMKQADRLTTSGGSPRLPADRAPHNVIAIPTTPDGFPNSLAYDADAMRLSVGGGVIDNVTPEMRAYSVDGVNVVDKWFSYRKADRSRPVIGDRRISDLMKIQPDHWLTDYTSDLVDLLNVIGLLVELGVDQSTLLQDILNGETLEGLSGLGEDESSATPAAKHAVTQSRASQAGQVGFDFDDLERVEMDETQS